MQKQDLTGLKVGTLIVQKQVVMGRNPKWLCVCSDCGANKVVFSTRIRDGKTSCECARVSFSGHELYMVWAQIKSRCENSKNRSFKDYGGRGITICDRWRNSFKNFLVDMGERPFKGASVDRKNNEKGYSPDNCKWSTQKEQLGNTRKNVFLEHNGVRKIASDWAIELGISRQALNQRLSKNLPLESLFVRGRDLSRIGRTKKG